MKESILDVLLYLFEHYFTEDADPVRDRDSLQNGLIQAGFSPAEISKAFDWLDALAEQRPAASTPDSDDQWQFSPLRYKSYSRLPMLAQ